MRECRQPALASALALCTLLMIGCGKGGGSISAAGKETSIKLDILASFYKDYMDNNRGRPPKDMEAFREYLQTRTELLESYKQRGLIESIDQLLVSSRDEEPFVVLFGKLVEVSEWPGAYYVAYEQTGVDEQRMVARLVGGVDMLDEQQFAQQFR